MEQFVILVIVCIIIIIKEDLNDLRTVLKFSLKRTFLFQLNIEIIRG